MNIFQKLDIFKKTLEEEYSNNAIKVVIMWDENLRLVSIGIDHPLWKGFLCDMRFLPKKNYDLVLSDLYDQFKHDLEVVNERISESYGNSDN